MMETVVITATNASLVGLKALVTMIQMPNVDVSREEPFLLLHILVIVFKVDALKHQRENSKIIPLVIQHAAQPLRLNMHVMDPQVHVLQVNQELMTIKILVIIVVL